MACSVYRSVGRQRPEHVGEFLDETLCCILQYRYSFYYAYVRTHDKVFGRGNRNSVFSHIFTRATMVTSTSYAFLLLIPLLSLLVVSSDAFGISLQASQLQKYRTAASTVVLRGISEWRDKMYDISDGTYNNEEDDDEYDQLFRTTSDSPPLKQLCLAPFPIQDALLPGETKHMHLFRVDHFASFVQLFDHSMQHDESMLGMLLFYNNRLDSRSTMPLCEIESYSRMGDDKKLGYIVNLRVVGRGHMVDILEDEPYMKAVCQEVQDDPLSQGLEVLNKAANVVVRMMDELSKLEEELLPVLKKAKQNNSTHPESTRLEGYSIMQRRAVVAKLVRICRSS
jgi:hypothetical protein